MVAEIKNFQHAQKNLETLLEQLAQAQNTKPQGGLISDTKNLNQAMEITLRIGRDLIDIPPNKTKEMHKKVVPQRVEKKQVEVKDAEN